MVGFGSCREQDFQFCLLFQQRLDFHKRARTDLVANFTSGDFDLGPDSNKLLIRFESKLLELVKWISQCFNQSFSSNGSTYPLD